MAKQPIYQLLVEIDFANKTESEREAIMRTLSNSIIEIAEIENLEVDTTMVGREQMHMTRWVSKHVQV